MHNHTLTKGNESANNATEIICASLFKLQWSP